MNVILKNTSLRKYNNLQLLTIMQHQFIIGFISSNINRQPRILGRRFVEPQLTYLRCQERILHLQKKD